MIAVVGIDGWLVKGLRFVLGRISDAVDAELGDASTLREQLLAAQMKHELGEIDDDEMAQIEQEILARLRELRPEQAGAIAMTGAGSGASVEVDLAGEHGEE